MRGVLGASEPFISPPFLFVGRGAAVRGGAAVMPRRFFASEYWRAVTATLRLRASALTRLNERVGAFRSQPSINTTVSAEDIDEGGRGSGIERGLAADANRGEVDTCTRL